MNEDKWTKYHWTLPKDIYEKLGRLADDMDMNRAYVLRTLVEKEYIERHGDGGKKTVDQQ